MRRNSPWCCETETGRRQARAEGGYDTMAVGGGDGVTIAVEAATVQFRLPGQRTDSLKELCLRGGHRRRRLFTALENVTLRAAAGESWGVVGVNGSGKSTLLKLIAGVVRPCSGTVRINGRLSALLELGAGFDGELTARENVYLNGAVLGHNRAFMKRHMEEIINFCELAAFMDQPLKSFSTGMAARLGFAVATAVQPEILLVDEALAVGDSAFQAKCRRRMDALLAGGATLVLVSHSEADLLALCPQALWLAGGRCVMQGETGAVLAAYRSATGRADDG